MQTIGAIATRKPLAIPPETRVRDALLRMVEGRISCLPICLEETAVGILTERDVVLAANQIFAFPDLTVNEIMTGPVLTVAETTPVDHAYRLLRRNRIRHLVVTDRDYALVGVVTQSDLVNKLPTAVFDQISALASLMTAEVRTLEPGMPVRTALSEMAAHRISCLVILEDGRPLGIFTERDAIRFLARGGDPDRTAVAEAMTHPVATVPVKTRPSEAIERMRELGIRRLVAVDRSGNVAGLITQSDLAWLVEWPPGAAA